MSNHTNPQTILLFALLFLSVGATIITVFIVKSRQKIYGKELEKRNLEIEHQKQIFAKTLETQETERKRIAQDLHDDISSKLIALSLNMLLLKSTKTAENEKINIMATIDGINKNAIDSSRKIAHHLFPPLLEKFGVHEAIDEIVSEYNASKQIEILYNGNADLNKLPKESQLHIFRITQELINNSIKHGKATKIEINFDANNCQYRDNGKGIDQELFEKNKGLGMLNIESRIASINGTSEMRFGQPGFSFQYSF